MEAKQPSQTQRQRIYVAKLATPFGPHRRCCFCGSISCETARTYHDDESSVTYLDPAAPESMDLHTATTARLMYWDGELDEREAELIIKASYARVKRLARTLQ